MKSLKPERRDAPLVKGLPIEVSRAFPRGDAGKVRRLLGGDPPLGHGHARVPAHADLAVAPVLGCEPLDEVIAVPTVLGAEHVHVALGMADAAGVHVGDGIALPAPVSRVGGLELGHPGNRSRRDPDDLPFVKAVARTFAEITP